MTYRELLIDQFKRFQRLYFSVGAVTLTIYILAVVMQLPPQQVEEIVVPPTIIFLGMMIYGLFFVMRCGKCNANLGMKLRGSWRYPVPKELEFCPQCGIRLDDICESN